MNPKAPLFFFHIPKTAGSTMQSILSRHYDTSQIAEAFTWTTLLNVERAELANKKLFQGHFYGPLEDIAGVRCNTFTVLRDPIERALSHYGHVRRDKSHYLHDRAEGLGTLEAYLADPVTRSTVSNFQSRMLALEFDVEAHFFRLSDQEKSQWLLERHIETTDFGLTEEQVFSAAQQRLDRFFFTGITERFSETLTLLCDAMRWKYPKDQAQQNTNPERPRRNALPPDTLKELERLNEVDLTLYSAAQARFQEQLELLAERVSPSQPFTQLVRRFLG